MFSECFVFALMLNAWFATTRGQQTNSTPTSALSPMTTIPPPLHTNCSEKPGYRDLNEVGAITFRAGKPDTAGTMDCTNCEQSGVPESVSCVNRNDSTEASLPTWTCSGEFPQSRSYKINFTSMDCERHGETPRCVDPGTCRLIFSVKRTVSNTGELVVVAFVVFVVFILLLIEIRRSMRRERALFASRILWLQDFSHSEAFTNGRKPNFPSVGVPDAHLAIAMSTSARFSTIASYSSLDMTPSSRDRAV